MKEGLYSIAFSTVEPPHLGAGTNMGSGVVYMRDGRISGGDEGFYYTGSYSLEGVKITGNAAVRRHLPTPGSTSIFGTEQANVTLKGSADVDGQVRILGQEASSGTNFQAALKWLAD